jgi:hypothetical protein
VEAKDAEIAAKARRAAARAGPASASGRRSGNLAGSPVIRGRGLEPSRDPDRTETASPPAEFRPCGGSLAAAEPAGTGWGRYGISRRLNAEAGQVWLFTTDCAVPWTNNPCEQVIKAPERRQAVCGYWHKSRHRDLCQYAEAVVMPRLA